LTATSEAVAVGLAPVDPVETAEITPAEEVIVVPSTSTIPNWLLEAFWIAGAASERIKVAAEPLIAVGPAVAVGLAPEEDVSILIVVN
jgi:hypothetical protein